MLPTSIPSAAENNSTNSATFVASVGRDTLPVLPQVTDIHQTSSPDSTTVVVDLQKQVRCHVFRTLSVRLPRLQSRQPPQEIITPYLLPLPFRN